MWLSGVSIDYLTHDGLARAPLSLPQDLRTRRKLLTRPDELLIFGGGSAGARGAMVWEERLKSLLPKSLPRLLYLDSPLWVDMEPYDPWAFAGFQVQTQMVLQLANASRVLSKGCARAYKVSVPPCCPLCAITNQPS